MMKSPCYKCEERHDLCHSHCEKYIAYRKRLDDINEAQRKERETQYALDSYEIKKTDSLKKRKRK